MARRDLARGLAIVYGFNQLKVDAPRPRSSALIPVLSSYSIVRTMKVWVLISGQRGEIGGRASGESTFGSVLGQAMVVRVCWVSFGCSYGWFGHDVVEVSREILCGDVLENSRAVDGGG